MRLRLIALTFEQLEQELLLARLLEIQAHIPRKYDPTDARPLFDVERDDTGDHCKDDTSDEYWSDEDDMNERSPLDTKIYRCPLSPCKRKYQYEIARVKHFEARGYWPILPQFKLLIAGTDVRCLEICTYCRESFQTVSQYKKHCCGRRRLQKLPEKEAHRKERCSQLSQTSKVLLSKALNSSNLRRKGEFDDPNEASRPPKKVVANIQNVTARFDNNSFVRSSVPSDEHVTPLDAARNISLSGVGAPSAVSNSQFCAALQVNQEGYHFAPIFNAGTIPPYYDSYPPANFQAPIPTEDSERHGQ